MRNQNYCDEELSSKESSIDLPCHTSMIGFPLFHFLQRYMCLRNGCIPYSVKPVRNQVQNRTNEQDYQQILNPG